MTIRRRRSVGAVGRCSVPPCQACAKQTGKKIGEREAPRSCGQALGVAEYCKTKNVTLAPFEVGAFDPVDSIGNFFDDFTQS